MGGVLALTRISSSLILALAFVVSWSLAKPAVATSYSGSATGYAFGNLFGSSNNIVAQGDFANHSSADCPSDPASYWPYGTYIYNFSPTAIMVDGSGNTYYYTAFSLEDTGDAGCYQSDYWVDLYFGRFKPSTDVCSCNNGGGDVCYTGPENSCDDAINWGVESATYDE